MTVCISQGTRIDLTANLGLKDTTTKQFAQLFVHDYFKPNLDGKFDLVLHFHDASWLAEDIIYK